MDKTILKSGLFKKGISFLTPFVKEPWREFTLTEIKKTAKTKSHHYVFWTLKKFTAVGVLTEKKKGNTNIYTLNTENKDFHYLIIIEYLLKEQRSDIPYKHIQQITKKIKDPFYTLIIGGSYVEGKQKPTSDLDIAFIIPNAENKKLYQAVLKEGELMIPEIHGYIFTSEEFYLMLTNQEFNYGKELARKHILYYGAEQYYAILLEAMNHGFKG